MQAVILLLALRFADRFAARYWHHRELERNLGEPDAPVPKTFWLRGFWNVVWWALFVWLTLIGVWWVFIGLWQVI